MHEPRESYVVDDGEELLQITEYGPEDEFLLTKGWDYPNYTQIPNQLLGTWKAGQEEFIVGQMADMGLAELKVALALCRLTFGFHREATRVGLTWLQKATGLSRQGVIDGVEALIDRGLFSREVRPGKRTKYTRVESTSQASRPPLVKPVDHTSQASRPYKESIKKEEKENPYASGVPEDEWQVSYYYKDAEFVDPMGKVSAPPWKIHSCIHCGSEVVINALDTPTECICAMHEYILLSKRPPLSVKTPEALMVYKRLTGRDVPDAWRDDVIRRVGTNTDFWTQVIKAYVGLGWNRGNISNMLEYFEKGRIPGTRQKKATNKPKTGQPPAGVESKEEIEARRAKLEEKLRSQVI